MSATMTIESAFADVKGQPRVVNILTKAAYAWQNGGNLLCPLITGAAGLGKTKMKHAYNKALQIAAKNSGRSLVSLFFSSPHEFRVLGEEYQNLRNALDEARPLFITIDEAQDFSIRKTVQTDTVWSLIKRVTDGNGYDSKGEKEIKFDDTLALKVNRKELGFACGTNFPEKLPDGDAMKSRFEYLSLDPLTPESQAEILQIMLKYAGLNLEESAIKVLASCGRGTARPYEKIVDFLKMSCQAEGNHGGIITRAQVLDAIKIKQLYPCGLTQHEVFLLDKCLSATGYKMNALAMMMNREVAEIRRSVSFLQAKDFINVKTSSILTTKKGKMYLESAHNEGFTWEGKNVENFIKKA